MGLAFFAIVVIAVGAALRLAAPGLGPRAGMSRLLSYVVMLFGVGLALMNAIVLINVGEVGVQHFLGAVKSTPLEQGVHFINPLASIEKMSVREQAFPNDGGIESIEAQTSEQLNVLLEISILYRIDGTNAPDLYQRIGTERQITSRIVLNAVRNGVRDAVATKSINDIFSPNRREIANDMKREIQAKAGDRIEVLDVFVRDVQAPARVREAIEEKLQREQQGAAERFQTEIIQERARQIITEGLTPEYLTFFYIEQLTRMPEGTVVYVPTEGGIPLIRNLGR